MTRARLAACYEQISARTIFAKWNKTTLADEVDFEP